MKATRNAAPHILGHRTIDAIAVIIAACAIWLAIAPAAWAAEQVPSVLVIDAGLGDYIHTTQRWLDEEPIEVGTSGALKLLTSMNPAWWNETGGGDVIPATFVLGSPDPGVPVASEDVVWALDRIRESGAQPKTLIVAFGAPGLSVRTYLEDLSTTKQSSRADVVGVVLAGTPNNGYSLMSTYPELSLWDTIAGSAGLTRADLDPASGYLAQLNTGTFPRSIKTMVIYGTFGDLGYGLTDGAGVVADLSLNKTVTANPQTVESASTIGMAVGLSDQWQPFTSKVTFPERPVDSQVAERLSLQDSYSMSSEVRADVRAFFDTWFSAALPTTHMSSVMALDLSGSMVDNIAANTTKLDGAKVAAREYLRAMQSYDSMPYAAPVSASVIGFSEQLVEVTSGFNDEARQAVQNINANPYAETNIGVALDSALSKLNAAPVCADKRILVLSDGAATVGQNNEQMLSGPVAQAAAAGIHIDTVGFGDVGESNAGFLRQMSEATGGTYYQANDVYELEKNFLSAYYHSLGVSVIEEELSGAEKTFEAGTAGQYTAALGIGVLGKGYVPQLTLRCNGAEVDPSRYTLAEEGSFVTLELPNPDLGDYTVEVSGGDDVAYAFAIQLQGIKSQVRVKDEGIDYSIYLLAGAGIALLAGLIAILVRNAKVGKAA